jgi:hypothetical protein
MRRTITIFLTSAGLALSVAGLAPAGLVTSAAAATAAPAVTTYTIQSTYGDGYNLLGHNVGQLVTVNLFDATNFEITGRTGKWLELKDTGSGDCLDLVGSVSAGFHVNEENCNGRSAELWWLPSGIGTTQIQNQYGTNLLNHDACMWNAESSSANVAVRDCQTGSHPQQVWSFG